MDAEEGVDGVRAGVTLPYSPEFSEPETNAPLLEKLAQITGGRSYADDDAALAKAAAGRRGVPAGRPGGSRASSRSGNGCCCWRRCCCSWTWRCGGCRWTCRRPAPRRGGRGRGCAASRCRRTSRRFWSGCRAGRQPDRGRAARRFEATGDHGPAPAGADTTGPPAGAGQAGRRPAPDSPALEGPEAAGRRTHWRRCGGPSDGRGETTTRITSVSRNVQLNSY